MNASAHGKGPMPQDEVERQLWAAMRALNLAVAQVANARAGLNNRSATTMTATYIHEALERIGEATTALKSIH